jgi:predicted nuclease of predicted toxin-antitoxin system
MRLLLDECAAGRQLSRKLEAAGHDILRSIDAIGDGAEDPVVFACAQQHNRALLTYNNRDFDAIGRDQPNHAGLLFIYQDNDGRDMSNDDIVAALTNVQIVFPDGIAGQIVVLNKYRW